MQVRSSPAPMAGPLMAQITGTSSWTSALGICWMPWRYSSRIRSGVSASSKKRFMSLTLPPELKMGPAAVMISTFTLASLRTSSHSCTNSCTAVLPVSALRVSGWFMVAVRMPPSRSMVRKAMGCLRYQKNEQLALDRQYFSMDFIVKPNYIKR
jgi:hypothetical protein